MKMMSVSKSQWLALGLVFSVVVVGAWGMPAPDVSNRGIADALKALERLDRYYSHVAMPR